MKWAVLATVLARLRQFSPGTVVGGVASGLAADRHVEEDAAGRLAEVALWHAAERQSSAGNQGAHQAEAR